MSIISNATADRRSLLIMFAGAGITAMAAPAFAARKLSLAEAAEAAFIYTLPLVEMGASRAASLATEGAKPNVVFHDRQLATPAFRSVTTPNNDTLYSRCWIDLSAGPVEIELPPTGDRYFSAALLDMYSNNFAILGTRTAGGDGGRYTLVGSNDASAPGAIRSPTPSVWLLVRTLISGPSDLEAVHAIQDQIKVVGPARPTPDPLGNVASDWDDYFVSAQKLLLENPPPATDRLILEEIKPLGLHAGGGFDPTRFSASEIKQIQAGVNEAKLKLEKRGRQGRRVNNWFYGKSNIGIFGQDYLYRAQVALAGLGALPRVEATYMRAVTPEGRPFFDPDTNYRLHFPAGHLPPVDSFWSLTMYERENSGQLFLADNPKDRYSIGNRTEGLKYNPDGSLTLWVGSKPQEASNWLPAPRGKPWSIILRAYLPQSLIATDEYLIPALEAI